jgi:hypothetical protein
MTKYVLEDKYYMYSVIPSDVLSLVRTKEEFDFIDRLLKKKTLSDCFQTMTGFIGSKIGPDIREKIAFGANLSGDAAEQSKKSSPNMFRYLKNKRKLFEDDVTTILEVCDDYSIENVRVWLLIYTSVLESKGFVSYSCGKG